MATRKTTKKGTGKKKASKSAAGSSRGVGSVERGSAVFPYTTRPSGLRRFLSEVPHRPKPPKVNAALLAGWNLPGGENQSILRVLKAVGLTNATNEPTDDYVAFMRAGTGPGVLARLIKNTYAPLFDAIGTTANQFLRSCMTTLRHIVAIRFVTI